MSEKSLQIAEMFDMLPEQEQNFAFEMMKKIVLAWDPDFTRVTPAERQRIAKAENSGFVSDSDIDWDNIGT